MSAIGKNNRYTIPISWIIVIEDILVLNSLYIVLICLFDFTWDSSFYQLLQFLMNVGYVVGIAIIRVEVNIRKLHFPNILKRNFSRLSILFLILLLSLFVQKITDEVSRLFVLTFLGTIFVFLSIFHWITKRILLRLLSGNRYSEKSIILGAGLLGEKVYAELTNHSYAEAQVLGFFDDNPTRNNGHLLGTIEDAKAYALSHGVARIYCALPLSANEKILDFLNFSEDHVIKYYIVPAVGYYTSTPLLLDAVGNMPVFIVRRSPLSYTYNAMLKRLFDLAFSFVFLVTLFPIIYLSIAIAIKLSSPGPVFFVQQRTGKRGATFKCYKFRSMQCNKEAHTKQATSNDSRTTAVGRFLRCANLDEVPQFINVFKGDMSIVGPRPHMLLHTNQYSQLVNKYMVRHFVKPGITGWAQVNGFRGETKHVEQMEGRIKRDIWYLENWSLWLDIKIMWRTLAVTIKGDKKAY
ncbi:MAG: undecaprenyl-phosphate glucose phosphotransferase [Prevotellaceae bacterium]|jgi:putative colanic acid biosynthesis UDP-glucose lipid carrier transferase|nr:undecaprenyl-phosphate glucose phosphotransferase [Prevotellaceae bacterium]